MNPLEYRAFLDYVYDQYVRSRTLRLRGKYGPLIYHERYFELDRVMAGLRRAVATTEYIRKHCGSDPDVYRIFTPEHIANIVSDVHRAVRFHNRIAEEAGFTEALDAHLEEIVADLDIEHLPEEDLEILRDLGSADPRTELMAMIYLVKKRLARLARYSDNLPPSRELSRAEEILSGEVEEFQSRTENSNLEPPQKPRRWFKGLGQIAQGTALSIGNIALAAGALALPVSPETATWGAITSSATGVGMISNGIGELRGE